MTTDEFDKAINMAIEGCKKISEIQKKAIIEKYQNNSGGNQ